MTERADRTYLEVTAEAGKALVRRGISGPVVMLNLLRFRAVADYSATPHLAPPTPISGEAAYQRYIEHTLPHLQASGGEVIFLGAGGAFLIGPSEERWDAAMLVRQRSVADFIAFASDEAYGAGLGHRVAALEDARLLPLIEDGRALAVKGQASSAHASSVDASSVDAGSSDAGSSDASSVGTGSSGAGLSRVGRSGAGSSGAGSR